MYLLNNLQVDPATAEGRNRVAAAHAAGQRPLCPCRTPAIPMYIAKYDGGYQVKRMPGSGVKHAPDCDSYEPPAELSGLGQVMDSAIKEDPESGLTDLKLAFSMSKGAARAAPVPSDGETTTVKSDGTKLTLRSVLHYLWDEAGFNRWSPGMKGKRSYATVRRHLLSAAQNKNAKRAPLHDQLFIPEAFVLDQKDAIAARVRQTFSSIKGVRGGKRMLKIVIAEVKEFGSARFGQKVTFKHLPEHPFYMDEKMGAKVEKAFANELELANADEAGHLVVVGTFSVSESGLPNLEEAALMVVSKEWIPYENVVELDLVRALVDQDRRFIKGLRFNLSNTKPLASVVTNDTTPEPVAMYLVPAGGDEDYTAALVDVVEASSLSPWFWKAEDAMPPLPAVNGYTAQAIGSVVAT